MSNSQRNIEKARELYLNRGVLKREFLRDEVVYSWVRARLVNIDPDKLPQASVPQQSNLDKSKIMDALYLHELGVDLNSDRVLSILLLDSNGTILNVWTKNPINRFYFNFHEDAFGTSGIGMALKSKCKSYAFGHEHYHKFLVETMTLGIPTSDNLTLGFIFTLGSDGSDDMHLISRLPDFVELDMTRLAIGQTDSAPEPDNDIIEWPSCLIGSSDAIQKARERIAQFKDSQLIFISGPKGIGKESTANFLHKLRLGNKAKFHAVYCDKIPLQRFKMEWLEDSEKLRQRLEVYEIGTVYFENFDVLPVKYQRKMLRVLDSKLVNSTDENPWNNTDVSFVLSLTRSFDETIVGTRLTNALQSRLKLAEISLPGLTRRKEDICPILGHMITAEMESDDIHKIIEETNLYDVVAELNLSSNLRDLDHITQDIIERMSLNGTVTDACIDEIVSGFDVVKPGSEELKTLSDIEREAIVKTLKALEYNMVRTAQTLGISRSTLYRKLEFYNIEIDGVR